jgi:GDP-mannose 4,6-dehydratase
MKITNKKILITGITGMVGSHLADHILTSKKTWKIYGCCRWRSDTTNINHLFKNKVYNKKLFLKYMDLTDLSSVSEVVNEVKPDIVFHLAAQSFPKASFNMRSATYETNIIGTDNLLYSLKNLKKKPIIHICSSSEVFGRVSKKELPIDENCKFHPASPYAISKIGTDLIAKFYFESYNMKILTTRMFTHTGPRRGDYFMESTFAKQIAMIEFGYQKPVIFVGNLDTLRTIADVRDAVRAYILLVTKKPKFGEVYNIGGSYTATAKQILEHLIKLSSVKKIKIKIDKNRLRPIDANLQIPNSKKFKKHTNWKPEISFEKTMNDLLDYWRERIKNNGPIINR